ncbi:hypothetical protein [Kibdelosporangium aridum]
MNWRMRLLKRRLVVTGHATDRTYAQVNAVWPDGMPKEAADAVLLADWLP